jgi:HCOMODA/2-hydroxy-3-carboxy-muconic semialdehyde decarboxylase
MDTISDLKQKLITACRILDREGIMDELGHLSVRCPNRDCILMNGGVSPGQARKEDIILLDLNGTKLQGKRQPAKETPLHLAFYRKRADVMAVAHTHSPTVVALSIAGIKLRAVDVVGASILGSEVPMYEKYGLVDNFDVGYEIVDSMGSHNIIVLKGHGNVVTGKSIEETCVLAAWVEKSAKLQYQAMLIGEPHWYPEKELHSIRKQVSEGKALDRAWNYYQWKYNRSARLKKREN